MIHTLYIEPGDKFLEVKKQFRKFLMTGGGVIRLREDLKEEELSCIECEFLRYVEPNGVAEEVIKQVELRRISEN